MLRQLIKACFLIALIVSQFEVLGQSDQDLLLNEKTEQKIDFKAEKPERTFVQKINPFYWIYTGAIKFYKKNISVQIASNCIFEETCSHYSRKLVNEKGIFAGIVLSLDRISRCNKVTLAETSPLRFTEEGKITESIDEYSF